MPSPLSTLACLSFAITTVFAQEVYTVWPWPQHPPPAPPAPIYVTTDTWTVTCPAPPTVYINVTEVEYVPVTATDTTTQPVTIFQTITTVGPSSILHHDARLMLADPNGNRINSYHSNSNSNRDHLPLRNNKSGHEHHALPNPNSQRSLYRRWTVPYRLDVGVFNRIRLLPRKLANVLFLDGVVLLAGFASLSWRIAISKLAFQIETFFAVPMNVSRQQSFPQYCRPGTSISMATQLLPPTRRSLSTP